MAQTDVASYIVATWRYTFLHNNFVMQSQEAGG